MSIREFSRVLIITIGAIVGTAEAADAQDRNPIDLTTATTGIESDTPPIEDLAVAFRIRRDPRASRSPMLMSMLVSTVALQALDTHSTLLALGRGAHEANPVMAGVARQRGAFIALKAGVTISTVLSARTMATKNKVAAIAALVAINSAYGFVVQHNYRVARRLR